MSVSNHINVPSYLDDELVRKSLSNEFPSKDLKVESLDISPATSSGDNYLSDVFRIHVKFRTSPTDSTTQQISLVVKCLPNTGNRGSVIEEMIVYEKEVEMFLNVIPQLSKIANNEFFAAKCYYATRIPERMLIFHDLKSLNYTMADRHAGLDFDHCALIMRKIGKFHAASMPFSERNMDLMNKYFYFSLFNPSEEKQTDCINVLFEKGLATLIEVAESNWKGFDPKITAKLKKLLPTYISKLEACLTQKFNDGFKVLNHADLWCNNMLFKYNEQIGKIEDVAFVDYQLCFYSSPGVDLNYAIANCPNLETRDRSDELIAIYHQALSETLKSVGYAQIPSLADVYHEIRRMEFFALVSVVSVLPVVMMEKTDSVEASFEAFYDEDQAEKFRRIQYSGKRFQAIAKPMLEQFDRRNLLDV
ncbi:uncharacterized protein LOC129718244 [Wyeomyia smithii]|uniref:uncharacterized protein LOC129718244 n=1 Tax=Wyeomyia smithii TaxID=174621 RepID=UPI002467BF82|nr:uncharacterized protein LOC129718244 [Wyeomyia smithii]